MTGAIDRAQSVRLIGSTGVLLALAWWLRFVQDDAFISFRYAQNWVRGHGLVWNPGDYVEGYTNFLWTVLMAVPLSLGWEPILFSQVVGVGAFAGTLLATHRLASNLRCAPATALLAVVLLGSNYSFSSYATGGLETQLQALLWACAAAVASGGLRVDRFGLGRAFGLSLLAAAALLTRLDSLLFAGPLVALAAVSIAAEREDRAIRWRSALLLLLPAIAIVAAWLVWKASYYGGVLPNTWYAKVGSSQWEVFGRGLYYVAVFFVSYLLFPLVGVYLVRIRRLLTRIGPPRFLLLNAPVALWLCYVAAVGGDFMEFRFLVPALPAIFVALAWTIIESGIGRRGRVAWVALALAGSALHAYTFDVSPLKRGLESIPALRRHVEGERGWMAIGRELGRLVEADDDLQIAVTSAGAIPYFSELRSVDMLGLNDPWIARHGAFLSQRAGHRRVATIAHLRERDVHLAIGHPITVPRSDPPLSAFPIDRLSTMFVSQPVPDLESLDGDTRMAMIRIAPRWELAALYLTPHPRIEALREGGVLRLVPLARDDGGGVSSGVGRRH
jgi:arabinofuranosyltransferase